MSKFKVVPGRKNDRDKLLLYNGSPVSFKDVAKMIIFFMRNEDAVYNEAHHKGAQKFIDYIREVLDTREIPNDKNYQLNKKELVQV